MDVRSKVGIERKEGGEEQMKSEGRREMLSELSQGRMLINHRAVRTTEPPGLEPSICTSRQRRRPE